MNISSINIVTIFIYSIILWYFVKGLKFKFIKEEMAGSIINGINRILLSVSIVLSLYIIYLSFFNKNNPIHRAVYAVVPKAALNYMETADIIVYIVMTLLLMLLINSLLTSTRIVADCIIFKLAGYLSVAAARWSNLWRKSIGIIIEVPGMIISVLAAVLLIGLLNTYYPYGVLASQGLGSKPYNYVYNHVVSPVMESSLGRNISTFIWSSAGEFSSQINGSTVIYKKFDLNKLELLRFRIETKSNEKIGREAQSIVGSEKDEVKKAYLLYKWIGSNVNYDWDKYNDILNNQSYRDRFGAINAYETRKGVCEDYADLYAAMAKAAGLKVRTIVGQAYNGSEWSGHAWNEVYIAKTNEWIPLDTTWASSGDYFNSKNFNKSHVIEAVAGEW